MDNTKLDTKQYVKAGYHLAKMKSDDRQLVFINFPSRIPGIHVDPKKNLYYMLEYAPTKHGQRYIACAILTCDEELNLQVDFANT